MKWLMNMPVNPKKDENGNYTEAWLDWIKSRHPENTEHHIEEWTKFLEGKIIGEPRTQARSAKVYKKMGWVGIYDSKPVVLTERKIRLKRDV